MSKNNELESKYMIKSTAYVSIALAFVVGLFVGSTFFTSSNNNVLVQKQVLGSGSLADSMNVDAQTKQHIADEEARLANDNTDADGWGHLGNLYFDDGQYQKAIDAYQKSLSISPNNTNYMTDMGTMYRALKQYDMALQTYDKVLALDPNHRNARFNRGVVLIYDLKRKEDGINTWKILIQKYPDSRGPNGEPLSKFIESL